MQNIEAILVDPIFTARVDREWEKINNDFAAAYEAMPVKHMARTELSFHAHIKLLAYLCLAANDVKGDVVEIGVWKGKSLALMQRVSNQSTKMIGIDPFELRGQVQEVKYFHEVLYPTCFLIQGYSQNAVARTVQISKSFKLLHIDGGHLTQHVWADFLLYERFVVPGGYIVFDDYGDVTHSPEVGPAVDQLREHGLFAGYDVIGVLPGYANSYVLRKKETA
ncbi:class I SAM-dependent methyltransferase [Neorhizobium sp. NPDC001467]|uniref:class I SAM-dependent methyltransferase n=1 Tax=Neorhizobium sp. NPDC001467 TaxID=3390595 RepID=UPI003D02795E